MLCDFIIATLLIASISSLEVQAEGNEKQTASPNSHHGILLGALTVQKNNTYVTGPNDKNVYGSVVKMEDTSDSSEPSKTRTITVIAPGGPGHEGISFAWTGDELQNLHQAAGKGAVIGAVTLQSGNTYASDHGSQNYYGSIVKSEGNVFNGSPSNRVPINYGAVTIQRNNNYGTSPDSKNYFGSIVKSEGNIFNGSPSNRVPMNFGAITIQSGNHYRTSPGSKNYFGSRVIQHGNVYNFSRAKEEPQNSEKKED